MPLTLECSWEPLGCLLPAKECKKLLGDVDISIELYISICLYLYHLCMSENKVCLPEPHPWEARAHCRHVLAGCVLIRFVLFPRSTKGKDELYITSFRWHKHLSEC